MKKSQVFFSKNITDLCFNLKKDADSVKLLKIKFMS